MKKLIFLIVFFLTTTLSFAQSQVWVNGYYRSNGTYVQGHYRTEKNQTVNDNWTTRGNVNPHTGKAGTLPRGTSNSTNYDYTTINYSIDYTKKSTYEPLPVLDLPNNYSTHSYSTSSTNYVNTNSKIMYTGPRGGTYYINSNGNKTYVR
jgi:hypothetical protein